MLEARNLSGHLEIDPDGNDDEQGDEDDALAGLVNPAILKHFFEIYALESRLH